MAKDIAAGLRGTVKLPAWHGRLIEFDATRGKTEVRLGGKMADAAIYNDAGQVVVAIEVKVSHAKDADDIAAYRVARVPAIEIALNPDDDAPTEAFVRSAIKSSGWLVEPFEPIDRRALTSDWLTRFEQRKAAEEKAARQAEVERKAAEENSRRRKTIDKAVQQLIASPTRAAYARHCRCRPWDTDRGGFAVKWGARKLFHEIGQQLVDAGFSQQGHKPYLFLWRLPIKGANIRVYADLGGNGLPSYESCYLAIYAFGINCEACEEYYDECQGVDPEHTPKGCNGLTNYLVSRVWARLTEYKFQERLDSRREWQERRRERQYQGSVQYYPAN